MTITHHGGDFPEALRAAADLLDRMDSQLAKIHINTGSMAGKTIADLTGMDAEVQSDIRRAADEIELLRSAIRELCFSYNNPAGTTPSSWTGDRKWVYWTDPDQADAVQRALEEL